MNNKFKPFFYETNLLFANILTVEDLKTAFFTIKKIWKNIDFDEFLGVRMSLYRNFAIEKEDFIPSFGYRREHQSAYTLEMLLKDTGQYDLFIELVKKETI